MLVVSEDEDSVPEVRDDPAAVIDEADLQPGDALSGAKVVNQPVKKLTEGRRVGD